jgi:WD40 repeat protein
VEQLALLTQIESNFAGEMAWSPDGTTLAVVYSNPVTPGIWLYDLGTLDSAVPTLLETEFFPTALEFSPDGALLVVGYENGSVAFFEGNELVFSAPAHEGAVRDLRFNPSGTVLASIGDNNTIKLWGIPQ